MHGRLSRPVGSDVVAPMRGRFLTLDAMRGVAAVLVMCVHAGRGFVGTWSPTMGHLAVDLFFVLSGFVIALKNDPRFERGEGAVVFLRARIARLYPLFILGAVLGFATMPLSPDLPGYTYLDSIKAAATGIFGLPTLVFKPPAPTFAGNTPLWSLFLEFWVANLSYALFWKALRGWRAAVPALIGALFLVVANRIWFTVDVGYVLSSLAGGFARVTYGFFTGVVIARFYERRISRLPSVPSWSVLIGVTVLLALPAIGGGLLIFTRALL